MEYSNADFLKWVERNKSKTFKHNPVDTLDTDIHNLLKSDVYKYASQEKKKQLIENIKNKKLERWLR